MRRVRRVSDNQCNETAKPLGAVPICSLMQPYERFDAWRLCHKLTLFVYAKTRNFPNTERYGLTAQVRRAAFSTAANIVEGSTRRGSAEFRRFLDISRGSLAEVHYTMRMAKDLKILPMSDWTKFEELHRETAIVTWKLYASLP